MRSDSGRLAPRVPRICRLALSDEILSLLPAEGWYAQFLGKGSVRLVAWALLERKSTMPPHDVVGLIVNLDKPTDVVRADEVDGFSGYGRSPAP